MPSFYRFFLVCCLVCCTHTAFGQQAATPPESILFSGRVLDGDTGAPLPAASVQLKGTYRGSITNEEGAFELRVRASEVPQADQYSLIFRFIGYETREVSFRPGVAQTLRLQPSPQEMEALVFTGEDPALHIMERVIARKRIWRTGLESWRAEAYTRNTLANADSLVSISESITLSWWQRGNGLREYVVDQQQTRNLLSEQNVAGIRNLPNFYDDEIEIAGFRMIGVTHPDAFRFYDFKVMGQRGEGASLVYDIEVTPATRLQPSFEGRISVLAEEYAMIEVELKPADMVFFPPPIQEVDLSYKQQFSSYGGDFWLPVDLRVSGRAKIGFPGLRFPEFRLNLASAITKYEVNIAVPDSVFGQNRPDDLRQSRISEEQRVQMGRLEADAGSRSIPLSEAETRAYARIDSTQSISEAFQPTGVLSGLVDSEPAEADSVSGFRSRFSLSPALHVNRVEALYAGIRPEVKLAKALGLRGMLGYRSGGSELAYGGGIRYRSPLLAADSELRPRFSIEAGYRNDVSPRVASALYPQLLSSAAMLSGGSDYLDYYGRRRIALETSLLFNDTFFTGRRLQASIGLAGEQQRSLPARSSYSFAGGALQRANPPIAEGRLHSLDLALGSSAAPVDFGFAGSNTALFQIQYADKNALGGDFSFTRYEGRLDLRINTFLKRRFLPNTLDVRLQGFTHSGDLPPQRFGGFDGKMTGLSAFGGFKTLLNRIMEGERGAAMFWEHNFRSIPLELLGLQRLAKSGVGVLVHGASGRTWLSEQGRESLAAGTAQGSFQTFAPITSEAWRHELGLSVNGIFSLIRVDATWRVDRPGFYLGISAARLF